MIQQEHTSDGWEITVTCEYCHEPVYTTGPTGRGEPVAALARIDKRPVPFCSPACRSWWLDIHTFHPSTVAVADGVGPAEIEALLPPGLNGEIAWET
jgi:hypothetical protein